MYGIMRFAIKILEFDKVRQMLGTKAATELGRAAAEVSRIATSFEEVKSLQEETAEVLRIFDEGKRLPFGGCLNISDQLKRAELGSVLEPAELLRVGSTLAAIGSMQEFLQAESVNVPRLAEYANNLQLFSKLEKQINVTVDEHGEIRDSASPKLSGLRNGIAIAKNRVKQQLDDILHNPMNQKYFQDNLVTMRGDRYVIPVKQEYKMNVPGIVHDQSSTGATLFIEPLAVVNLNNDIKRYMTEEREEVERILRQMTANIGEEAEAISSSLNVMTALDVISARGYLALEQHAVRPQLVSEYKVDIHEGRHPLLNPATVVPLTVQLGGDYSMLLITGPNTGGKTVALKTVGLFALMAQSGMFIPALNAVLPVFNAVYADIGDEQSIEQSLSTFSAHMKTIIGILKDATSQDLVLIDELCAGTDPNEGAALAMSILEELNRRQISTMVTTHYSELKTFAYGHKGMLNASVEFDAVSLMPTYKLLMGVPGSSNAFNISLRLGLQENLVDGAKSLLNQEHIHMENVLADLDSKRRGYERSRTEIEKLRFETEMLRNQLAYQKREFMKHREELLRRAREKADEIYRDSRREAEEVLKELRSHKADFDAKQLQNLAEESRKKLNKKLSGDVPVPEGTPLTLKTAKSGQTVFVTTLGKTGHVAGVNKTDLTVQVGILRLNVRPEQCLLTVAQSVLEVPEEDKKRTVRSARHALFVSKNAGAKQEVDLRGKLVEEALPVIDKAIDDAMLSGVTRLRIIHGKGTGALKAGVLPYLQKHPLVQTLEMAAEEEGGAGVTVVTLV